MNETKTVFITGASRGIGRAIADAHAKAGHRIITPSRSEMDLSDSASIAAYLGSRDWAVDILVNNAGENPIAPAEKVTAEAWSRVLQVNLTAPLLLIRAFAPHMKERRWGRIVNISSIYGLVGRTERAPYSATKSGLIGLSRTLALELAPHQILVNAICPGFVETDLTRQNNTPEQIKALCSQVPLGRLAQPEEIARLSYFLASEENSFITGQAIVADGGFTAQ